MKDDNLIFLPCSEQGFRNNLFLHIFFAWGVDTSFLLLAVFWFLHLAAFCIPPLPRASVALPLLAISVRSSVSYVPPAVVVSLLPPSASSLLKLVAPLQASSAREKLQTCEPRNHLVRGVQPKMFFFYNNKLSLKSAWHDWEFQRHTLQHFRLMELSAKMRTVVFVETNLLLSSFFLFCRVNCRQYLLHLFGSWKNRL